MKHRSEITLNDYAILQEWIIKSFILDSVNQEEQKILLKKFPSISNKYKYYDSLCNQYIRQTQEVEIIDK